MRLRRVSAARMSVAEAVMTSRCRSSSSSSSVLSYLIHQLNGTCQRQRRVKYCLDSSKSTCCRGVRCEQTWLSGPRSRRPSLHLHVTSDVTRKDEAPQQVEAGMIRTMRIPDPPRVKDMDWSSRVDGTRRNSEIGWLTPAAVCDARWIVYTSRSLGDNGHRAIHALRVICLLTTRSGARSTELQLADHNHIRPLFWRVII